jgi:uncharacterized protein YwgA
MMKMSNLKVLLIQSLYEDYDYEDYGSYSREQLEEMSDGILLEVFAARVRQDAYDNACYRG